MVCIFDDLFLNEAIMITVTMMIIKITTRVEPMMPTRKRGGMNILIRQRVANNSHNNNTNYIQRCPVHS